MVMLLVGVRLFVRERHQRRGRLAADHNPITSIPATHRETLILVGIKRVAELYLQSVVEFSGGRIAIAGVLGRSSRHTGRLVQSHAILGRPEDVENVLRDLEVRGVIVDRIVVASAFDDLSLDARTALLRIETTSSIRLDFIAEWISGSGRRQACVNGEVDGEGSDGSTFLISPTELQAIAARPYWRFKRAIDLILVSAVVVMLAPLQLLIASAVALDIGVPVLFWQQRPGRAGRPFRLRKFRTMGESHGADGLRLADSARISTTGRFLRRTRLDELPQLYNILAGDMSFVGPRPLLPVDQPGAYKTRLIVRPGLTGWAQVMGGRDISPADKAALDVWYVRHASFALDLKIVCLTIPMLIRGERIDSASISVAWDELERSGICARRNTIRHVEKMRPLSPHRSL